MWYASMKVFNQSYWQKSRKIYRLCPVLTRDTLLKTAIGQVHLYIYYVLF